MPGTTLETHSGLYYDYADPRVDQVTVADIAFALSMQPRFGGHARYFYSIAEHAVLVYDLVKGIADPVLAFAALHHDSHEAYLGDIPTPLKRALGEVVAEMADDADAAIAAVIGIDASLFHHAIVKAADEEALHIEARLLRASKTPLESDRFLPCYLPCQARRAFERAHAEAVMAL